MDVAERRLTGLLRATIKTDYPLSALTYYRTGGPAKYFAAPANIAEARDILSISAQYDIPLLILGSGSNVLVSDKGWPGIIMSTSNLNIIRVEDDTIKCQAGVKISKLLAESVKNSLSGAEFLAGIPGTVGGATYVNAGLKEIWISDIITSAGVMSLKSGKLKAVFRDDIPFCYRTSGLKGDFVYETSIQLQKDRPDAVKSSISRYVKRRASALPARVLSAGSVFKNPPGFFAGQLVERAGLKGFQIGGARVSPEHGNFIINVGDAVSQDIYRLIMHVQQEVEKLYQVRLEPEIHIIGEF